MNSDLAPSRYDLLIVCSLLSIVSVAAGLGGSDLTGSSLWATLAAA